MNYNFIALAVAFLVFGLAGQFPRTSVRGQDAANEPIVAILEMHSFDPNLVHDAIEVLKSRFDLKVHTTTDLVYRIILFDRKAGAKWGDYYR